MRLLKTNTATRITVGPFFDKTDGITPEVALTVTNCKLTFTVDDGGVPTLVIDATATASGGDNDMVHITNDDAGFYDLELTAANVNYVGRAMLAITDAANHCPVFHEFMIVPAKIYDSLVGGTDNLEVDTIQWLGTACATPTVAGVPEVDLTHVAGSTANVSSLATNVDAILTDTGTTLDTKLNNIQGATFDTATDSLEALRNRGDAAWVTATGFSTHSAADVWAAGTRTLTTSFPTNFSSLSITAGGKVSIDLTNTLTAFTGVPGVTPTINEALYFSVQSIRNKKSYNKTNDTFILKEDDGTTTKMTHTMTDNATEATRGHGA